jgi:hypothetical protein
VETCPSGLRSTLGKRVCGNVSWVQIPASPPFITHISLHVNRLSLFKKFYNIIMG